MIIPADKKTFLSRKAKIRPFLSLSAKKVKKTFSREIQFSGLFWAGE